MTIGKRILRLRKEKQLSQQALANKLNVSRQTVSKWENDLTLPNLEDLTNLSHIFQITIDELLNQGIEKQDDIKSLYQQVQIVFEKTEKETKLKNCINYLLIIICFISTLFTVSTGFQIKKFNDIYHQQSSSKQEIFSVNILDVETMSEFFVGISNTSGGRIPEGYTELNTNKFNLEKRTVSLSYQFTLKEYYEDTKMDISFDGKNFPLEKVNNNTFVFNEEISLQDYENVIVRINHPNKYTEEVDIGKNKNCYYLTFVLFATTSFYLPVDYGPNLVELDKINYILDPTRDSLQRYIGYRFNSGDIKLDIYNQNEHLLVSENFELGKKAEKKLDIKLPINERLKVIATITVNNQKVVMTGTLVPTKNANDRIYVSFNQIAGMV